MQALLAAAIAGALCFIGLEIVIVIFHRLTKRQSTRNTHIFIALLAVMLAIYEYLNYLHR